MSRRTRAAFFVALAVVAAAFLWLNFATPYFADDYSYMFTYAAGEDKHPIRSLAELWSSQLNHYKVMNGRAIVHTLVQLLLIPSGKALFNVLNTAVFMALGFAGYYAAYGTFRRFRPLSLFALYALIWLTLPDFGQSCLWLTGSVNYMWTTFFALLFLLPYRTDVESGSHKYLKIFGMPFLGILAGWSGENACLAAAVALVLLLARRALLGLRFKAWMFTGAAGFIAGAAALFLSPAQALKAENMGGLGSLRVWLGRIPDVTLEALEYLWLPLALGLILLAVSIVQVRKDGFMPWLRKYSNTLVWLCAAVVAAYCMCAAPYFPLRAWCCSGVLAGVTVLAAFSEIRLPERLPKAAPLAVCALVAAVCAVTYGLGLADILATKAGVDARTQSVAEQKAAGAEDVYVQSVTGSSRYNCFTPDGDVAAADSWINEALALYYGVERVFLAE